MSRPLLTVICPVTRMAGQLHRLQDWLDRLSDLNTQVIIVHDKRDQDTSHELQKLLQGLDPKKVSLIEGEFGSAGSARNQGLIRIIGNWVCFWDADDSPHVEEILTAIRNSKAEEIVIGQFQVQDSRIESNSLTPIKAVTHLIDLVQDPGLWRCVFRSEIIKNITFPNFQIAEDQGFLAQIPWDSIDFIFDKTIFYTYYRGVPNQLTTRTDLIPELTSSVQFLQGLVSKGPLQRKLIEGMVLRQKMTILKYFYLIDKVKFSSEMFRLLGFIFSSSNPLSLIRLAASVITNQSSDRGANRRTIENHQ
jgi:glycosyltransferase involved in cell wall biosynthesis